VSLSLLGAAATLGLSACGGGTGSPGEAVPADALQPLAGATTLDGSSFERGAITRPDVLVWFWAPWCVICRSEAPAIAEIAARYGDRLTVVGVAGRGGVDDMAAFVADTGTGHITHIVDSDGAIWSAYGVYGQPAFAFIDDDGSVQLFIGSLGEEALVDRVDTLLTT